jgi:LuxR family maltose regulon positive regulatory protein
VALIPTSAAVPWWSILLAIATGRVSLALGDLAGAGALLEQARRGLARYPDAGILSHLLAKQERALEFERGGASALEEPLTHAELRVLALAPTHLTLEEIGSTLYISRNTVKTHLKAIYGKLGVASRSEAVQRARALRLLDESA